MNNDILYSIVHSKDFINKWKIVLDKVYKYESYMDYIIVPSLSGKKTLSYMPFLNFTNRLNTEVSDLLELGKDNDYQIRVLNPNYVDFKMDDPVDMRVDISLGDSEKIFNQQLHQNCRRKVRQSIKRNNFEVVSGKDETFINDFYPIFSKVMHNHGTPVNKKEFFQEIIKEMDAHVFVYKLDNKPIAASIILFDNDIAELYWNVIDNDFSKTQIGYFSFWNSMQYVINERNCKIFDFGRSSFGGATYKFKKQWGAEAIKIDILKSNQENIYNKYKFAANVWKRLPRRITELIGPKLCKYLVDL